MEYNLQIDGSGPLTRALANGNSQANRFQSLEVTTTKPSGDGVYVAGDGGLFSMRHLFLLPIAESMDAAFNMRVWGWYFFGGQPAPAEGPTWIPVPLIDLECVTGSYGGIYRPRLLETGVLTSVEFLAKTIKPNRDLVPGELAISSQVNGFAKVNLMGCRLFQFDFEYADQASMNCLWATQ